MREDSLQCSRSGEGRPPPARITEDAQHIRGPVPEDYDATYFFSNISEWGRQSEGFMQAQAEQYDVIGFAEMHLRGVKILDFTEKISKDGWKAAVTAAVPSGRSTEGTTGGEAIISKRSLATTSFEGWRQHEIERSAVDPFQGFCPMTWHTKAGNIVVISAYMQPKHGMTGANERMMVRLASFINMISDPWVVLADWNNPPEAWAGTKWLRKIGGQLILPENTKTTCNLGRGSLIDYGICKNGFGGSLKLEAVPEVPWKTHVGLLLSIRAGKQHWWHRVMQLPKQLPTVGRPVKEADPNSKRQKSLAERRQRAKARLQEELQDAYEELHSWPTTAITDSSDSVTFEIPLDLWRAAAATVAGQEERVKEPKPSVDPNDSASSHFLLTRNLEAQEQVASAFGNWVQTVEQATLKHHDIPESNWSQYEGRGRDFKITWRRTRAAPARAHMRDPLLWWHLTTTIIARYQLMRRRFAKLEYERLAVKMKELLDAATENNLLAKFTEPDEKQVLDDWTKALADLNEQHIDSLQGLLEIGMRYQARAVGIGLANGRRAFASWVTRMWKQAPGVLHRHVKPAATRRDEHYGQEGSTYATPCEIMDRRAEYWENIWSDSHADSKSILDGLEYVTAQAKREDVDPLELEDLDRLLAKQNPKKSRGIDNLGPIEVQRLPEPGRKQMLDVLNLCEKHLMWPHQLYTVIGAVAPKPKGGDRILGMLPYTMKVWSKLRYPLSERWSDEIGEFWDTAIKGSSPLQASLARACMDECCFTMGISCATILLDLEKFYDSISIIKLCQAGLMQGFPAVILAMELQMFLAPRYLRERQWISRPITIGKSLVAGSPHGGKLAKALLGPILQRAHEKYQFSIMMKTFVDDTIIRSEGTASNVETTLVQAGTSIGHDMLSAGLTISPKTVVVASSSGIANSVARALRGQGIRATSAHAATDLGADVASGRARARASARRRMVKASRRAAAIHKIRRIARLKKESQGLWKTGAMPSGTYSHQHHGLPEYEVLRLRRQAAAAASGVGPGRCLTTALGIEYGDDDPAKSTRRQQIAGRLTMWRQCPSIHERIQQSWDKILARIRKAGQRRWRIVRGPVGATIATLLEINWDPISATQWDTDAGKSWLIPAREDEDFKKLNADYSEIFSDINSSVDRILWARASKHQAGDDLHSGGDFSMIRQEHRRFAIKEQFSEIALNTVVTTGGQWTRTRMVAAAYDVSPLCPRCGDQDESLFHRIWTCAANCDHEDYTDSNCLIGQAVANFEASPSFWLRGVPAASDTIPVFDESPPISASFGDFLGIVRDAEGFAEIFGDGSGGEHSSDRRRRRAGLGFVSLAPGALDPIAGFSSSLAGRVQTVPRAELSAFLAALEQIPGKIRYMTDHLALAQVWSKGVSLHLASSTPPSNVDLWTRILEAAGDRVIQCVWIPAHVEARDIRSEEALRNAAGNECADLLAGLGAQAGMQQRLTNPDTDRRDAEGALIRRRARRALAASIQADPWTSSRPEAPVALRVPILTRFLRASQHQWRKVGAKYFCRVCSQFENRDTIREGSLSRCCPRPQGLGFSPLVGHQLISGKLLCSSHKLTFWGRFGLTFCNVCGKSATSDPRWLMNRCQPTPKGTQDLARIARGLFPNVGGPPQHVLDAENSRLAD